ncbi:MAG: DUF2975 domain-containing protein [Oscillospiraceae bacterium]|nr:DUF2975 domain-containing protein [Oscillospiraceae bacterium]
MNTKREKILKMSKILDAIMKIGAIFFIMTIAAHSAGIIMAPSLDLTRFTVGEILGSAQFEGGVDEFRAIMLTGILSAAVMPAILFVASFIFKDISRGTTPFTTINANRLRVISLLLLALSIVIPPLKMLLTMIFFTSVRAFFSISIGQIVCAVMFVCLALIFEYGAELQRESDETL